MISKTPYGLFTEEIDRKWPELRDRDKCSNVKEYSSLNSSQSLRFRGHIILKEAKYDEHKNLHESVAEKRRLDRRNIAVVADHLKSLGYVPCFDGSRGLDEYPSVTWEIPVGTFEVTAKVEDQETVIYQGQLIDRIGLGFRF